MGKPLVDQRGGGGCREGGHVAAVGVPVGHHVVRHGVDVGLGLAEDRDLVTSIGNMHLAVLHDHLRGSLSGQRLQLHQLKLG